MTSTEDPDDFPQQSAGTGVANRVSQQPTTAMPQGDKSSYTDKQKRQASHIKETYEDRGISMDEAEKRAWATVNKESGGGKKSGGGRKKKS